MASCCASALAQGAGGEKPPTSGELAKQLQNPVSELITFPFQANVDTGLGRTRENRLFVHVQPVMPLRVTTGLNVIGPALLVPTATKTELGRVKFGIGPSAANETFVQPFVAYTLQSGLNFGLNSETTINWRASAGNR